jgi:hypothetical protein
MVVLEEDPRITAILKGQRSRALSKSKPLESLLRKRFLKAQSSLTEKKESSKRTKLNNS